MMNKMKKKEKKTVGSKLYKYIDCH